VHLYHITNKKYKRYHNHTRRATLYTLRWCKHSPWKLPAVVYRNTYYNRYGYTYTAMYCNAGVEPYTRVRPDIHAFYFTSNTLIPFGRFCVCLWDHNFTQLEERYMLFVLHRHCVDKVFVDCYFNKTFHSNTTPVVNITRHVCGIVVLHTMLVV